MLQVHLVNKEHLPFSFTVDGLGLDKALLVEPSNGVVPADSRFPLQVRSISKSPSALFVCEWARFRFVLLHVKRKQ